MKDSITVRGARIHNLKNITVSIPRNKMTVITGLSGSGKSSLAFDTIYAEGQRRYVESLSTYARQFLQLMEKPDVDAIEGLSPAISIDQKTAPRNPRSTVGTVTEIYDYFRLLFAKIGHPHCHKCGKPISRQTVSQIVETVTNMPEGKKIILLSPLVRDRKGSGQKVFEKVKKAGFVRVRVDGEIYSIVDAAALTLDENKKHSIEIVVDRLVVKDFGRQVKKLSSGQEIELPNPARTRLADSVETALRYGEGLMMVLYYDENAASKASNGDTVHIFSENFSCPDCSVSIPEISPRSFSFNSPHGACTTCHGLGTKLEIDPDLIMPNKNLTLAEGAILPWSATTSHLSWYNKILEKVARGRGFSMNMPISGLSKEAIAVILYGDSNAKYEVPFGSEDSAFQGTYSTTFEGVIPNLERRYMETDSDYIRKKIEQYMRILPCPDCHGNRLKAEVLAVKINELSIIDVTRFSVTKAKEFFSKMKMSAMENEIARQILHEIQSRLQFLQDVGLSYLTLERTANTLSGGEAQRIRLATQIGSKLSGVIYVLDEPSIGLHQDDNDKLIKTLYGLRDIGNTVIVVEHDVDTMLSADHILDIGPGAGNTGGYVVAEGTPAEVMKNKNSVTGQYLAGIKKIPIPGKRRAGNGKFLKIIGAAEHNLRNITVEFPLGVFIAITGVSGSGKSTLINDILVRKVAQQLYGSNARPGKHERIEGLDNFDKIINIDQSPIGRTPRSNAATYTGVFADIRELFAGTPEAKLRGYKSGRFSFNVKGGRCEECAGDGLKRIEMHFLPDVYVACEACKGRRYNNEALEITYRGKSIADVLDMTVTDALAFFENIPTVKQKLQTLAEVGLDYIHLGQSATTLSGGEAQRIKLATELSRKATGRTLYVLDEPTTGLHFDDIKKLLHVLQELVSRGNTVLTIEHNLDVIKSADYIVDLGPGGGDAGGEVVSKGTPERLTQDKNSLTGKWLKRVM